MENKKQHKTLDDFVGNTPLASVVWIEQDDTNSACILAACKLTQFNAKVCA